MLGFSVLALNDFGFPGSCCLVINSLFALLLGSTFYMDVGYVYRKRCASFTTQV